MMSIEKLIQEYQCSGCISGGSIRCGSYEKQSDYGERCISHYPGTMMLGAGKMYLGLPRGMNKVGDFKSEKGDSRIRIWVDGNKPEWDMFNLPVWCKQDGDNLIVKTVMPRRMEIHIDIIQNATKDIIKMDDDLDFKTFDITDNDGID